MTTRTGHHTQHPNRGPGRYSDDGLRWWDGLHGHWFAVLPEEDTLEIELEDVGDTSWVSSVLTTLSSQSGSATYRFVGVASSDDPRWPTYRIAGGTFVSPRSFKDDLPPQEQWARGMTKSLQELREELLDEGWTISGHGDKPWSYRYTRPCIDAPADHTKVRHHRTGARHLW
ncbi:hypothetical protein ACVBEQ_10415 [Nakamurella sp. GG22]